LFTLRKWGGGSNSSSIGERRGTLELWTGHGRDYGPKKGKDGTGNTAYGRMAEVGGRKLGVQRALHSEKGAIEARSMPRDERKVKSKGLVQGISC